jgi:hypothetical protein
MKKLLHLIFLCLLVSCLPQTNKKDEINNDPALDSSNPGNNNPIQSDVMSIEIDLADLESLNGQHYEGWLIIDGAPVSTGRFNITSNGETVDVNSDGEIIKIQNRNSLYTAKVNPIAETAALFVLTIEPNGDFQESPSSVHLAGGPFQNLVSVARTSHQSALGNDFSTASGAFILATPSNGPTTANQGIWNINPAIGASALNLPVLPAGWIYEGWVVDSALGSVNSTGTFRDPNSGDSDLAGGPKAGLLSVGPAVPGQDLINPAVVLNDGNHVSVITIEPYPDYDDRPFSMKVLRKAIPSNLLPKTLVNMGLFNRDGFPEIVVTLKR